MKKLMANAMPPISNVKSSYLCKKRVFWHSQKNKYFLFVEFWTFDCCAVINATLEWRHRVLFHRLLCLLRLRMLLCRSRRKIWLWRNSSMQKLLIRSNAKHAGKKKVIFHLCYVYSLILLHRKWLFVNFSLFQNLPSYHKMFCCISSVS